MEQRQLAWLITTRSQVRVLVPQPRCNMQRLPHKEVFFFYTEIMTPESSKPKRLYFKTYLQFIRNSVGTEMFRNFYIQTSDGNEMDALDDGSNSCAFYVSSVLTLFGKHSGMHGTVKSTVADLQKSGWQAVSEKDMRAGDVLLWNAIEIDDAWYEHVGFYIGDGRAVSTSWTEKRVVEHDLYFDGGRTLDGVFRQEWES